MSPGTSRPFTRLFTPTMVFRLYLSLIHIWLFALGWRYTPLPHAVAALRADHHTSTGQRQRLVLADGSRVWLNTRSALDVDYRRQERRLIVLDGEILVQTCLLYTSWRPRCRP